MHSQCTHCTSEWYIGNGWSVRLVWEAHALLVRTHTPADIKATAKASPTLPPPSPPHHHSVGRMYTKRICVLKRAKSLITFTMNYYRYICTSLWTQIDKLLNSPRANCAEHTHMTAPTQNKILKFTHFQQCRYRESNRSQDILSIVNTIAIITTIMIIKTVYIIQYVCMGHNKQQQQQQQQCKHT